MPPKHKTKGKGVGKGQSNRHKSSRPQEGDTTSKEKNKTASNLTLCSADVLSIYSSPDHSICHNNTNIENASDLGVCKNNIHSRYRSRLVSKEDPLMADLVWRSVSPDDERIPRLPFFSFDDNVYQYPFFYLFEHYGIYIRI